MPPRAHFVRCAFLRYKMPPFFSFSAVREPSLSAAECGESPPAEKSILSLRSSFIFISISLSPSPHAHEVHPSAQNDCRGAAGLRGVEWGTSKIGWSWNLRRGMYFYGLICDGASNDAHGNRNACMTLLQFSAAPKCTSHTTKLMPPSDGRVFSLGFTYSAKGLDNAALTKM